MSYQPLTNRERAQEWLGNHFGLSDELPDNQEDIESLTKLLDDAESLGFNSAIIAQAEVRGYERGFNDGLMDDRGPADFCDLEPVHTCQTPTEHLQEQVLKRLYPMAMNMLAR